MGIVGRRFFDHAGRVQTPQAATSRDEKPFQTDLDDLHGLAFMDVCSTTKPNLAGLLGCSKAGAYYVVKQGGIPVIRSGHRVRVAVPALLRILSGENVEVD